MNGETFWNNVKKLIIEQNTTQEWVAQKASMNFGTLKQQIFHNRLPDAHQAYLIAKALNTSVEYLVTGQETNPYKQELDELKERLQGLLEK